MEWSSTAARRATAVSVAILGLLIVHNLYWGIRNATEPSLRYRILPRYIAKVAARTGGVKISRYAVYYWMEKNVRATALTIPPFLKREGRVIATVTGFKITVARENLTVRPGTESDLRAESRTKLRYLVDAPNRILAMMYFVVEPEAREYVLAEGAAEGRMRQLFLLPAARFAAAQAERGAAGSAP